MIRLWERKHNLEIIDIFNEDATMKVLVCTTKEKTVLAMRKSIEKETETKGVWQNRGLP
jgi:valyl-tRNA synthetase